VTLNGLLNLASEALQANAFALNVTGQNIANASTPGYVNRTPILETQVDGSLTTGGVLATGVSRSYDQFTQARLYDATGLSSAADSRNTSLQQLQSVFNDSAGTGLAAPISALFSSFSSLAANPTDATTREGVVAAATGFTQAVNAASSSITQQRSDLLSQAQGVASEINGYATQLASLNTKIAVTQGEGGDASDLLDQRDQLLTQLSADVDVHTATDGKGQLVVSVSGTTLVDDGSAATLSVSTDTNGNMTLLSQMGTGPAIDVTSQLTGGQLAGIKEARDVDAAAESQSLDQLTYDIGTAINTQQEAGYASDGSAGQAIFTLGPSAQGAASTIAVNSAVAANPDLIAAASSAATAPGGSDNAVALANLANENIASGGTATAADAYASIVGDVGLRAQSAQQDSETRDAMTSQVQTMRDSTSGVSLDEQMVALSNYQSAYSAASQLITTANTLLNGLITAITP
jgi:flagellar hook-associated protein 1 FlgK